MKLSSSLALLLAAACLGAGCAQTPTQGQTGDGGSIMGSGGVVTGSGGKLTGGGGTAGSGGTGVGSGGTTAGSGGNATGSGGVVTGSGGTITGSGGFTGSCTNVGTLPASSNQVQLTSVDAYCFSTSYTIDGWTCWNFAGRTVTVNGQQFTSCGGTLPAKQNGLYNFQVSAGTNANAGIGWWGTPGGTGSGGSTTGSGGKTGSGGTITGSGGTVTGSGGRTGSGGTVTGSGGQTSTTCTVPSSPATGAASFTWYNFAQGSYQEGGYYRTACGYRGTASGTVDTVNNIASANYFAAIPGQNGFDSKERCGGCINVKGKIFTIIDECPYGSDGGNQPCAANPSGHMDLSKTGFDTLGFSVGNPTGQSFTYVPCPVTGNVKVRVKPGNPNQAYFENVILPIKSASINGSGATRLSYGAWQFSGNVAGATVTLTDWSNRSISFTVPSGAAADQDVDTGKQFPSCN